MSASSQRALEEELNAERLRDAAPKMLACLLACAEIIDRLDYPKTANCIREIVAEFQGKQP